MVFDVFNLANSYGFLTYLWQKKCFLFFSTAYCEKGDLNSVCSGLAGDATLYTLFRSGAAASPCPFKGPLEFSYRSNEQVCKFPLSQADACTQDSRLLLRYMACADQSTESYSKYFSISAKILIRNSRSQGLSSWPFMTSKMNIICKSYVKLKKCVWYVFIYSSGIKETKITKFFFFWVF